MLPHMDLLILSIFISCLGTNIRCLEFINVPLGPGPTVITTLIGDSFMEQIVKKREDVTHIRRQNSRRRKLNVPAGKSISFEDVAGVTGSTEDQNRPSNSQNTGTAPESHQRKKRVESDSSSDEDSDCIPYAESDESLNLIMSDGDGETEDVDMANVSSSEALISDMQHLTVGQHVLVKYNGDLYPGEIILKHNDNDFSVSAMQKNGHNWIWPQK